MATRLVAGSDALGSLRGALRRYQRPAGVLLLAVMSAFLVAGVREVRAPPEYRARALVVATRLAVPQFALPRLAFNVFSSPAVAERVGRALDRQHDGDTILSRHARLEPSTDSVVIEVVGMDRERADATAFANVVAEALAAELNLAYDVGTFAVLDKATSAERSGPGPRRLVWAGAMGLIASGALLFAMLGLIVLARRPLASPAELAAAGVPVVADLTVLPGGPTTPPEQRVRGLRGLLLRVTDDTELVALDSRRWRREVAAVRAALPGVAEAARTDRHAPTSRTLLLVPEGARRSDVDATLGELGMDNVLGVAFLRSARRERSAWRRLRPAAATLVVLAAAVPYAATSLGHLPGERAGSSAEPPVGPVESRGAQRAVVSEEAVRRTVLAWRAPVGGAGTTGPVVDAGVVYVVSTEPGRLYAFPRDCTDAASCRALWTSDVGATAHAPPVVADGLVYVAADDGRLLAVPASCRMEAPSGSCAPAWVGDIGGSSVAPPAVSKGNVYAGSNNGRVYAFAGGCAAGDRLCRPAWVGVAEGGIDASPTVSGGNVYVGSSAGRVYAFAAGCVGPNRRCLPTWAGVTGGPVVGSPAVSEGTVFVGSTDGKLYAFATACESTAGLCSPLWTAATGGAVAGSPTVAGGTVYVGSTDGRVYAFATACISTDGACAPLWVGETGGPVVGSPTISEGTVYVRSGDGKVYAFSAGCASGGAICPPLWAAGPGGGVLLSPPVLRSGLVFVGSSTGAVYALRTACRGECQPVWTGATGGAVASAPAVADGMLYAVSADGHLYAFAFGRDSR